MFRYNRLSMYGNVIHINGNGQHINYTYVALGENALQEAARDIIETESN